MNTQQSRKNIVKEAKRIVLKIGSAVLTGNLHTGLDSAVFENIASSVQQIKKGGAEVVLVTSGAIAVGMKKLGIEERPGSIPERQAIAALGQSSLIHLYEKAFTPINEKVAQILLTHDDLANRQRFLNARNTLMTLLELGITPIINENDTVAVDEIKFGDNDHLAALVTNIVEANLLVILTDIEGIFSSDPKRDEAARLIPIVDDVDNFTMQTDTTTGMYGTGGIKTKVEAARKAAHFGVATIVANGMDKDAIKKVCSGDDIGTMFLPVNDRLTSKKHWIAFSARPTGRVFVDDGALSALTHRGKSLLPSGVIDTDGQFDTGEVVHCVDRNGKEFARGISNYSSIEIEKIKGLKTSMIERVLGYRYYDEIIHRDNLVLI